MNHRSRVLAALTGLALMGTLVSASEPALAKQEFATPPAGPVVYVTGQDLFYDSIVVATLPPNGPFQLLEMDGPSGFQTEFGPGDEEYVGGRWWLDDGDGMMGPEDLYFSCPLLGLGRDTQ